MRTDGKLGYRYGHKYGVGLPVSFKKLIIERLPYSVCYKLTLFVFIVDSKGKVEEFDWKKLRKLQKNRH